MKKNMLTALIIGSLSCSTAFAGLDIPLPGGVGNISGDGYTSRVATISLNQLNSKFYYDISCKVNAAKANVKFRVDVAGVSKYEGGYNQIYFDSAPLVTQQAIIKDLKDHYLTVSMLKLNEAESNLIMTWLAGDNETDSMHFECSASHSVGLKS